MHKQTTHMLAIEKIVASISTTGIDPAAIVTVVAVVPIAGWMVQLAYKTSDGALRGRLLNRADEIIATLASDPTAEVKVSVEIQANVPNGAEDQTNRAVSENAHTLAFINADWE